MTIAIGVLDNGTWPTMELALLIHGRVRWVLVEHSAPRDGFSSRIVGDAHVTKHCALLRAA
eukprot:2471002-Lingulodinium_polyedra.AAC.1